MPRHLDRGVRNRVQDVDHPVPLLDERDVIIRDGIGISLWNEIFCVPKVGGLLPHAAHDFSAAAIDFGSWRMFK